jgi:predicted amidohydrolase YtcJ
MKYVGLLGAIITVLGGLCGQAAATDEADYLFTGGAVYTLDEAAPWAEAVAIRGNSIVYVGDAAGADAFKGPGTRLVDATGKMIMPGFIDAHVHPIWGGRFFTSVQLRSARSKADVQAALRAFRKENPNVPFIIGGSWVMENFGGAVPDKSWIDEVISDVPVLLSDHFGHSALANSKTFELAGIDAATADPEGGHFVRDGETGELTGLIREDPAIDLVGHLFAKTTPEMDYKALKAATSYLNRNGITSFVTAYMVGDPLGETFVEMYRKGDLTARSTLSFRIDPTVAVDETMAMIGKRRAELDAVAPDFLKADMAKLFLDGVILSHTAAMLAPYEPGYDANPYEGYLFRDETLEDYSLALSKAGLGLHYHTVGDGAARQALDTVEHVRATLGTLPRNPTISHLTVLSEPDIARFKTLGVVANAQFYWGKHQEIITRVEAYLGEARSSNLYAYGSIARAGGTLAAGSDWPVSTADPFDAMEILATRPRTSIHAEGDALFEGQGDAWLPQHKVDVATMIRAFTIEGAKLLAWDHMIGSLEVGKRADLVMVDRNILDIPSGDLHRTEVQMTLVDGKVVFEK